MTATFNLKALFAATAATAVVLGSLAAGLGSISQGDTSAAAAPRQTTLPAVTVVGHRLDLAPVTVTARRLDLQPVTVVAHRVTLQPVTVVGHKAPADTVVAGVQTVATL
jgi:hypothetical protein